MAANRSFGLWLSLNCSIPLGECPAGRRRFRWAWVMGLAVLLLPLLAVAQTGGVSKGDGQKPMTLVKAARLIDGVTDKVLADAAILVEGERIIAVGPAGEVAAKVPRDTRVIDLGSSTLLPGLIDAHTHVMLQGDATQADYDEQLLKESIPYRTLRASAAMRTSLWNGFTTLRDLGTEGAMYADVDLKTAVERGIIPGPRLFVSTRAMAPTGMYPLRGFSWELKMPDGVQVVDGVENIRRAVREEAGNGADWIKAYFDRKYYLGPDGRIRSWLDFTEEEMRALVDEAHRLGKKVSAHTVAWDGIDAALRVGVDSIEHGDGLTEDLIDRAIKQRVYWCPTIMVGAFVAAPRGGIWLKMVELERIAFGKAVSKGMLIALGTDAGGFPWTDNQARELSFMVRYGMAPMAAIQAATIVPARLLGQEANLGSLQSGKFADIIAVAGDPLADISELERVTFVMKNGVVYKGQGAAANAPGLEGAGVKPKS